MQLGVFKNSNNFQNYLITKKENVKFLEAWDIDLNNSIDSDNNNEAMKNTDNTININNSYVIMDNLEIIVKENDTDFIIIEIKENRKELNLFTLDFNYKKEDMREK